MAVKAVSFTLNGQTYNLALDAASGQYKATITAPATTSWNANSDHKYHGTVQVQDEAGNKVTATVTDFSTLGLRVLEKDPPTIAVSYPTAGAYLTNSKPAIKWTVEDTGSGVNQDSISIKIDSGTAITSGITKTATANGYTCTYTPSTALAEGAHTITINAEDNDGNVATAATVTFAVDTVPPTLSITAPANGLITNQSKITVSGTTNDVTSSPVTVSIKVNGGAAITPTVGTGGAFSTQVNLTEGSNTITIVATDSAGKTTTVTRTVTLDTNAPTITAITLTPNPVDAGKTFIISVTVSDT